MIRKFRFPVILVVGMEICYFLSGYIFWYNNNVLSVLWSSQYSYFPSYYSNGFWIIPLLITAPLLILVKYGKSSVIVRESLIVSALFIGSFVNAFSLWQIPEFIPDAILWNYQARYIVEHSIPSFLLGFGRNVVSSSGLPLPTLIFGLAYSLFGVHRFSIQLVNSTLFSLIVVLGYLIGRELFTREVGVYSGIILLSSPFMVSQVPLTLVDVATTFFVTLSIYQILRLMKKPGLLSTVLAAVTVLLASLCKITSLFFLFPFLLVLYAIMILRSRQKSLVLRRMLLFFTTLALLLAAVTLPFYATITKEYWSAFSNPFATIISTPNILNVPFTMLPMAILQGLILSVTIPVFILALLGLSFVFLERTKKRNKMNRTRIASCVLLATWIIVPIMYTLYPVFLLSGARYMMPTYPAYAVLAASFLPVIKDKRLRRMICVSILVLSIVSAQFMYGYTWSQSPSRNLMYAAEYLQPKIAQGASVVVCYPNMAAYMSIYAPAVYPKDDPFDLSPRSLFSCIDPNATLPEYLVIVIGMANYIESYPNLPDSQAQFLITHYRWVTTFDGGDYQVAWAGLAVEIWALK